MEKFIEYLEEIVDLKKSCSIRFKAENGGVASIETRLYDVNLDSNDGYVKTAEGLKIPLSHLVEVNGMRAQNIC